MKTHLFGLVGAVCLFLLTHTLFAAEPVVKTVLLPGADWQVDPYAKAGGKIESIADGDNSRTVFNIDYAQDAGFQWWGAGLASPITIPGKVETLRIRYRSNTSNDPLTVSFTDAWGRREYPGRKVQFEVPLKIANDWETFEFKVPEDWVFPITLVGVGSHNWEHQNQKRAVRIEIQTLEAAVDLSDVDPKTGNLKSWQADPDTKNENGQKPPQSPLFTLDADTGKLCNVFAGEKPSITVFARNWSPQSVSGKLTISVHDQNGTEIDRREKTIKIDNSSAMHEEINAAKFGLYTVDLSFQATGESASTISETNKTFTIARLPQPRTLTPQQKIDSPYGMNVHGGRNVLVTPFTQAGIVWFRDYAFSYEWTTRAKGADKNYAGWPYYPKILEAYENAGGIVLPCIMGSINEATDMTALESGKPVPAPGKWTREMIDLISAHPNIKYWELDNEYDLHNPAAKWESAINWANYRAIHKKFGEIVNLFGDGELVAVENGRAGIFPDDIHNFVTSGDFANIDVINSHYYCGVPAPERSYGNWNPGADSEKERREALLLYDRLRLAKQAAQADGKSREHWLTEIGWDTLEGNVVSPYEQAVYLQRAYMLCIAAGTEKIFWFFDLDSDKPNNFFDGCGLLGPAPQCDPKLSLVAFAALTNVLPSPKFVGFCNAGDGTTGYVFEQDGKNVAILFAIDSDETGPTVAIPCEKQLDYLGNVLDAKSNGVKLTRAPMFFVGVPADALVVKQAVYSLDSPSLLSVVSGDQLTGKLRINNTRREPISGEFRFDAPKDWTGSATEFKPFSVKSGESTVVEFPIHISPNATPGEYVGSVLVRENNAEIVRVPIRWFVRESVRISILAPKSDQKNTETQTTGTTVERNIKIENDSSKPISGTILAHFSEGWKGQTQFSIDIPANASGQIHIPMVWSSDSKRPSGKIAQVEFIGNNGVKAETTIVSPTGVLTYSNSFEIDGKLSDEEKSLQFPAEMLKSTHGKTETEIFTAWSEKGLYIAAKVDDSQVRVDSPQVFWNCDVLELFISTRDKPDSGFKKGDHQFWLVPQPDKNLVYLGRWKRGNEIDEPQYDIPNIRSASTKTDGGYFLECVIPAEKIDGFVAQPDKEYRVNFNLSVRGQQWMREVYWPEPKNTGFIDNPGRWGSMIMEKNK